MAYNAGDGTRYHSASRARLHDEMTAEKNKGDGGKKKMGGDGDGAMKHEAGAEGGSDMSHMPIHEVVKAHGPAHKVEIEHDHEGGSHKKTSHHGEGHKHTSEHGSAKEAHEAGMEAAGETPGEVDETPDEANGEHEEEMIPASGGGIPGIS